MSTATQTVKTWLDSDRCRSCGHVRAAHTDMFGVTAGCAEEFCECLSFFPPTEDTVMGDPDQDRNVVLSLIQYMTDHREFRVHGWNLIRLIAKRRLRELERGG